LFEHTVKNIFPLKVRILAISKLGDTPHAIKLVTELLELPELANEIITGLYAIKGAVYKNDGNLKDAIKNYEYALSIYDEEYTFLDKIREKIKKCKEKIKTNQDNLD